MDYKSTRDASVRVSSAQAIARGISADGGLFVPDGLPQLTGADWPRLAQLDYMERAKDILGRFLTDFSQEELSQCVTGAYGTGKFDNEAVAPLADLGQGIYMLELWHGPTCAFKDMALQLLPHLLSVAASKTAGGKTMVILVATSGDTGKAALEGFKDVPGTKILVFYPEQGVSPMQKLQMVTQEGGNVSVCAIQGNFDDAQTGVKTIFTDQKIADLLAQNNMMFSSANSINWGRLAPQIVYYISAYCDLLKEGRIENGQGINVVVPTGNFGNILAAYYAKKMGLPVHKLICASNCNNVLTDFIRTGVYDRNRPFHTTISPSMDILISSNLERLLFDLCGENDATIREWMEDLKSIGRYEVSGDVLEKLHIHFYGGYCDDAATQDTIRGLFEEEGYLCDTHTAVGLCVYRQYQKDTGDDTPTVIASTANPFKFSTSVLEALKEAGAEQMNEFQKVAALQEKTHVPAPAPLTGLADKEVRFSGTCTSSTMENVVLNMLGIEG